MIPLKRLWIVLLIAFAIANSFWLNTETGVRHNSGCRYYQNTKEGRSCGPTEGRACGLCGG
jgi:hypothetical protein